MHCISSYIRIFLLKCMSVSRDALHEIQIDACISSYISVFQLAWNTNAADIKAILNSYVLCTLGLKAMMRIAVNTWGGIQMFFQKQLFRRCSWEPWRHTVCSLSYTVKFPSFHQFSFYSQWCISLQNKRNNSINDSVDSNLRK